MSSPLAIDADGHVEPALVLDWERAIGGSAGAAVSKFAKRWFDEVGYGSSTRAGAWDPGARLTDMDDEGIERAVVFGSSRGPASVSGGNPELEPLVAPAFNDWLHEYCSCAPARLKAAAWIALDDIETACKEATRAVEQLGAVGVVINPCAREMSLDDPHYSPLYEVLQDLDVPALVHGTGAVGDFLTRRYQTHMRRHAVAFPLSLQFAVMDLLCGGVLERFDRLRVAVLEGGVGWVPWWISRLDEHHELQPFASPFITEKPSVLVGRYVADRRLCWSCEPEEPFVGDTVRLLGTHAVVFASDYPHIDCTFPGAVEAVRGRSDLDDDAKRAVLRDNALALYGERLTA
jgi:predicted TIM-barrel fold metal-dependent hydrolase